MKKTKKAEEVQPVTASISNCNFAAVHWDKPALEVVQTVATALLKLTELFRSQGVTVETMVKIDNAGASISDSKLSMNK